MKLVSALLLFIWVAANPAASPEIQYFRYQRAVTQLSASGKQTCIAIDPEIYPHATPQLADLRLYSGATEIPYVLRTADPIVDGEQSLAMLNLGQRAGRTVFDAQMPPRTYADVEIAIARQDFLATVEVSGSDSEHDAHPVKLGSYTIFDLTRQKLGRSTVLHLPDSNFRFLHFALEGPISAKDITGLTAMRATSQQPKFRTVAVTSLVSNDVHATIAEFNLHENVPVDRVSVDAGQMPVNFSREVRVRAAPPGFTTKANAPAETPVESTGNILRVRRVQESHTIHEEQLSVVAPRVATEGAMHWTVTIENGDDHPISIRSIRLEMMERDLCFDATAGSDYALYYGDAALQPPHYDYSSLFELQKDAAQASTGPETANPSFQSRPDARPFTERHPVLLWVALAAVVLLLGGLILRTAKSSSTSAVS